MRLLDVECNRLRDILETALADAHDDGFARSIVRLGGLPTHAGQCGREETDVLAGARGDFEHAARRGQHGLEHREDGILVALRGG